MPNALYRAFEAQRRGKEFERLLLYQAQQEDILCIENGQRVTWLPGGKTVATKCQLDFTLLNRSGQAVFADAKTVAGASMPYSAFDPRQLELARQYQARGFVSGFLILFRLPGQVSFFSAADVDAFGPRKSAKPGGKNELGAQLRFGLSRLFDWPLT